MKQCLLFLLAGSLVVSRGLLAQTADKPVRLVVKDAPLTINGREVPMMAITQENGSSGYSPNQDDGFHVEVVNQLNVPTSIHWHGLILPPLMDGVPYVSQDPIPPGGTFKYDFPLKQSGSYWMHSHYGLQEQFLNSAPLVIWTPEEKAKADVQHVVMLSDFSFTAPADILKKLKGGMAGGGMKGMRTNPDSPMPPNKMKEHMEPMATAEEPPMLYSQAWDGKKFIRRQAPGEPADVDVRYDALLANRRTIQDPELLVVKPGQSVLLRLIAASAATDFYVDTGILDAELLAVDGKPVEVLRGNYFQLAVAQRIDLRVKIPEAGGAFPILFQGEGTRQLAGFVLATAGANAPALSQQAEFATASLDNTQERMLRAKQPLAPRAADKTFPAVLGGSMGTYVWTINGAAYPNHNSFDVKEGDRVEIEMKNTNAMGHPMHLHGHDFQVIEIDGEKIPGALRDTVEVPPGSTIRIAFDANNPGLWAFHCHILYHLASGMFTVLKYENADTKFWQPEKSAAETANY